MATLSDYMSGTISLANGSVTVTGTGTLFEVTRFREGDTLQIQNLTAVIASVDSNTQLTLAEPWTGIDIVDGPYRARQLGDGSRVSTQAATIIELLGNGVLMNLAELGVEEGKAPVGGPAGQYVLEPVATDPNGSLGKLAALTAFPIAGLMNGFGISNDPSNLARSIVVSPGVAIDDISSASIALASGMSKGLNTTWQAGSGFGGLDVGAVAASTWYHVFAIVNPATGNSDILFSGSLTNPTLPTGYTKKRRIASIFTDASANIIPFVQSGDYFAFKTPVLNVAAASSGGSTPRSISVTTPFGLKVDAVFGCTWGSSSSNGDFVFATVYDPDLGGATTDKAIARLPPGQTFTAQVKSQTDNSARIMHWTNAPGEGDATISVWTHGYYDTRGRI